MAHLLANADLPLWMDEGNCSAADPTLFFGEERSDDSSKHAPSHAQHLTRFALKLCEPCPVREQCLKFAIENEETYGIWGGLTPRQRSRYQRQRASQAN